jgi:large subunit ribosomal protein L17
MRKFHRIRGRRRIFIRTLASNLVVRGKIETTIPRAKEIRPLVERFVTIAKRQNLHSLRLLKSRLPAASAEKLYYDIAPRYQNRNGGYLRITKEANTRKRDGTSLAIIAFVE